MVNTKKPALCSGRAGGPSSVLRHASASTSWFPGRDTSLFRDRPNCSWAQLRELCQFLPVSCGVLFEQVKHEAVDGGSGMCGSFVVVLAKFHCFFEGFHGVGVLSHEGSVP